MPVRSNTCATLEHVFERIKDQPNKCSNGVAQCPRHGQRRITRRPISSKSRNPPADCDGSERAEPDQPAAPDRQRAHDAAASRSARRRPRAVSSTVSSRPDECTIALAGPSGSIAVDHRGVDPVGAQRVHPDAVAAPRRVADIVTETTAALVAAYTASPGTGPSPEEEATLTTSPPAVPERGERGPHAPQHALEVDVHEGVDVLASVTPASVPS